MLFAITKGEMGGAQEHVRILAEGMARRGCRVGLLVATPSQLADRLARAGVTVIPWPDIVRDIDPRSDLRARRQLQAAVEQFHPDVLHLHSAKAGVLGRRLRDVPVTIYTCHHPSFGPGRKLAHRVIGRVVEQCTLRWTDGIISVGSRDVSVLRRLASGVPVTVVRNAVPLGPAPATPSHHDPVALWVARMQHPKDPLLAVSAWELVVRRVPGARLIMCGTGPLSDRLADRIARSPARDNIEHVGYAADLATYRAQASVFLLATRVEGGTTMATLEAMAGGLVPVVSDAGDARLLADLDAGVVVPPAAREALADALISVFEDRERLARLRAGALSFARERWTTDDMVRATLAFYEYTWQRKR